MTLEGIIFGMGITTFVAVSFITYHKNPLTSLFAGCISAMIVWTVLCIAFGIIQVPNPSCGIIQYTQIKNSALILNNSFFTSCQGG